MAEFPAEVSYIHVSLPLPYHPQALAAARIGECLAETLGLRAFSAWVSSVYSDQDSLGVWPCSSYLTAAGIRGGEDALEFAEQTKGLRAKAGSRFVASLGVEGTPTVLVNGRLYDRPPNRGELRAAVQSALDGS